MKKFNFFVALCVIVIALTGCSSSRKLIKPQKHTKKTKLLNVFPAYLGPKARIAVADFDVKANKATFEIGAGLRQVLMAALTKSLRFEIIERQVSDLILTATVIEFDPRVSGGRAGIGGGGGAGSGMMGGLLSPSLNKAHLALEIRIVDNATSQVILSRLVYGQVSDAKAAAMSDFLDQMSLANGLSVYSDTPMEKAICTCIIEAVRHLSQNVPARYYKY
jgi:curli biogenesis system outer membrane secretion channel CsgG